jgi:predicted dehydrogenase
MTVRHRDIRTKRRYGGGTLYDIGVYCINAPRNLFRAEPTEVSAVSVNSGLKRLAEIDETTAATLRFGDGQLATFVTSFNAADVAAYRIVGTRGHLHADPAYEYAEPEVHADYRWEKTHEKNWRTRSVCAGAAVLL